MEILGRQLECGVSVESVRGVAESAASVWLKKISTTVVERANKVVDESVRNVMADSLGNRIVQKWIEGDIEGNLHANAIGYLLYSLYGAVSPATVESGVYRHTFSDANTILYPSLSLFAKDGAISNLVFSNVMLNSLEISAAVDDYLKVTGSFMGKESGVSTDTPSYETDYDFIGKDITVKFADTEAGLAGATAVQAKDLTVTWSKDLINNFVLGAEKPSDILASKMAIEGSITVDYEDTTYKALYLADSYKYMQITVTGSQTIGAVSHPILQITLHRVAITDWNREDSAADLSTQPITFKAFYNQTDSKQSEVKLTNTVADYEPVEESV